MSLLDALEKLASPPVATSSNLKSAKGANPARSRAAGAAVAKAATLGSSSARSAPRGRASKGAKNQVDYGAKRSTTPNVMKAAGHTGRPRGGRSAGTAGALGGGGV